jgi:dynein heavy chain 2
VLLGQALGVQSIAPPQKSLAKLHEDETNNTTPILMITTAGADPGKELAEFAEKTVGRDHYHELAMGGGQSQVSVRRVTCLLSAVEKRMHSVYLV